MQGEYIYKAQKDTIRVRVMTRESIGAGNPWVEWDYDIFFRDGRDVETFSVEYGDVFATRRDAKIDLERRFGKLEPINPQNTVTEGWTDSEK